MPVPRDSPVLLAAALFSAGILLTGIVAALPSPLAGEDALARQLQRLPGWITPAAEGTRLLTGTTVVIALAACLAGALFLARQRWRALCIAVTLAALVATQGGIKDLLDRPRPSEQYVDVRDSWTSPSYPAGHAMGGTYLVLSLALAPLPGTRRPGVRRAVWAATVAFIAANALANVLMGVHWPTDVAGGLLFGAALALIADAVARRPPSRQTR